MSSLAIRNMNWTVAQREDSWNEIFRKRYEAEQAQNNAQFIRDNMTREDYQDWWLSTPDNNHEFFLATELKVAEIKNIIAR
jgi:hypothetical protein